MIINLNLNDKAISADVVPERLLVDWLRDELGLTGTHVGCDTSQCGACNILVNGLSIKACTMLAVQVDGCTLLTIEGLTKHNELHPMQAAFRDNHGLQCGFCTPGMIIAGIEIVRRHGSHVDAVTVAHELDGNICRCTGYQNIVAAIIDGARRMGASA